MQLVTRGTSNACTVLGDAAAPASFKPAKRRMPKPQRIQAGREKSSKRIADLQAQVCLLRAQLDQYQFGPNDGYASSDGCVQPQSSPLSVREGFHGIDMSKGELGGACVDQEPDALAQRSSDSDTSSAKHGSVQLFDIFSEAGNEPAEEPSSSAFELDELARLPTCVSTGTECWHTVHYSSDCVLEVAGRTDKVISFNAAIPSERLLEASGQADNVISFNAAFSACDDEGASSPSTEFGSKPIAAGPDQPNVISFKAANSDQDRSAQGTTGKDSAGDGHTNVISFSTANAARSKDREVQTELSCPIWYVNRFFQPTAQGLQEVDQHDDDAGGHANVISNRVATMASFAEDHDVMYVSGMTAGAFSFNEAISACPKGFQSAPVVACAKDVAMESRTSPCEQDGPSQPNVISFNAAISDCWPVALGAAAISAKAACTNDEAGPHLLKQREPGVARESRTSPCEQDGPSQPNVISFNAAIPDCWPVTLGATAISANAACTNDEAGPHLLKQREPGIARESHTSFCKQDGPSQPNVISFKAAISDCSPVALGAAAISANAARTNDEAGPHLLKQREPEDMTCTRDARQAVEASSFNAAISACEKGDQWEQAMVCCEVPRPVELCDAIGPTTLGMFAIGRCDAEASLANGTQYVIQIHNTIGYDTEAARHERMLHDVRWASAMRYRHLWT